MTLAIDGMTRPLAGSIVIAGAKNASLPLMAASLLREQTLVLDNVPSLSDTATMVELLQHLGVSVSYDAHKRQVVCSGGARHVHAPYHLVSAMRASFLVLGPLLARNRKARVALPGGCAIGNRPVDYHLAGLHALGATIDIVGGDIVATAPKGSRGGLRGANIRFPNVSVGATANLLMAAALAKGETQLENCAQEPEIGDLANCLKHMGVLIEGIGSTTLTIQGKDDLETPQPHRHRVIEDRIEAGSYALAVVACGGNITLKGCVYERLQALWDILHLNGIDVQDGGTSVTVTAQTDHVSKKGRFDVTTSPYPGFPTDLQAQLMAVACVVGRESVIHETIFENRFMHVDELRRMGADITVHKNTAWVRGGRGEGGLVGTEVRASDLRSSMGLVIAALAAKGRTLLHHEKHVRRGYEDIEKKMRQLGAQIEKIS